MNRILLALFLSIFAIASGVGTGSAAATSAIVSREIITSPIADSGLSDDCRPGITGNISGTDVVDLQRVSTSTHFHFISTTTDTARIDWSDGSYSIIGSVDHLSFTTGKETTVFTNAHKDYADTYSSTGVFLFRGTFHRIEHFTDISGVTRVQFERSHLRFFGDC